MKRQTENIIDVYLKEISPESKNITEVIEYAAEVIGVAPSTIFRWREINKIAKAEEIVSLLIAVNRNRPDGKKCTLKDVAILCNYKKI